jgi:predicted nucleic acid-binding OB-fold protein
LILLTREKDEGVLSRTRDLILGVGKKNLLLLQEGRLSKEEGLELRSNAFLSVGQANQKGLEGQHGNANTEIVYDDLTNTFRLNVYLPPLWRARTLSALWRQGLRGLEAGRP